MRWVFFPLDEELKLLAGAFTPSVVERIVRLGTWMPFVSVTEGLAYFSKVTVSEPTVRRKTEEAGQAYVAVQTAQVAVIERDHPAAPAGPAIQQLSVDGAMVPLVHKEWGEVKTLAVGVVGPPVVNTTTGEREVHSTELSYFSRLSDHETFSRLATVETQRRGTETAGIVCAVNDGAEWEQGFVDDHRPDAVRILDWGHGAEHVSEVGRAVFGRETPGATTWRTEHLTELKTGDPARVLADLRQLCADLTTGAQPGGEADALKVVTTNLEYFAKRRDQICYAAFVQAGYPIGSGAVESGNKLLVEARLKGSGMPWAPEHVNPMVALRTVACNDRWDEAWPQIVDRLRAQGVAHSATRRAARSTARVGGVDTAPALAGASRTAAVPPVAAPATPVAAASPALVSPGTASTNKGPSKPAANHPWRRLSIGRTRQEQLAY